MKPWIAASGQRNPFAPPVDPAAAQQDDPIDEHKEPPPERTPEQLGLQLTGVLIAGGRREAIIGQHVYREGDCVERAASSQTAVASDDVAAAAPLSFRVVKIHPRQVVLFRKGVQYVLSLPEDRLANAGHNFIQVIPPDDGPSPSAP